MKKTSIKELRSFSKAELIRYVQYVEGEPLRAHHTAARTYIYELRLERVNKRYDAAIKELNALTQGPKTLQEFGEGGDSPLPPPLLALRVSGLSRVPGRGPETASVGCKDGQGQVLWMPLPTMPVAWGRESMPL